jgi:hypothetical protein
VELRPEMMIMGHDCERGMVWEGDQWEEGGGKVRILRGKEDQITLHVYIQRQLNEIHQTLFKKKGRRERKTGIQ